MMKLESFEAIRAGLEQIEALALVHCLSWREAYKGLIPDKIIDSFTPERRAGVFRTALKTRPEEYYLFEVNGRPAGLALLYQSQEGARQPKAGEIYALYFAPEFWGSAATGQAMDFCLRRLWEEGFETAHVWVLEENHRARRYYEKHGFSPDGTKKQIRLGNELTELRYQRRIITQPDTIAVKAEEVE